MRVIGGQVQGCKKVFVFFIQRKVFANKYLDDLFALGVWGGSRAMHWRIAGVGMLEARYLGRKILFQFCWISLPAGVQ